MYSVWFRDAYGDVQCFISDVPSNSLAGRIADNLVDEGFTTRAWVEQD